MNVIFCNVVPHFFHPSSNKSQIAILWPFFVNVFHFHLIILSLFSIKEQTLQLTLWIIPPLTTKPSTHISFITHYAWNILVESCNVLPFYTLPSTSSFCFFFVVLIGDLIGIFHNFLKIHNISKDFKEDFKNHKVAIKVLDSYGLGYFYQIDYKLGD